MKPAKFKYIAPNSPEEVVGHLAGYQGEARCLSGGQSLLPLMNFRLIRPEALIDLNRCPGLDYLRQEEGRLVIGPMTTQTTVEYSDLVKSCCPLISKTMIYLGSPTIRNRGTIGGTLAHADRTAELPAVALALEAELIAQSPDGVRSIPAEKFFRGDLSTDLQTDEMLREIRFPVSPARSLSAFTEATNRHHDLALAGVAVHLELAEDGTVAKARIVCNGIGPSPFALNASSRPFAARARMTAPCATLRFSVSTASSPKATFTPAQITAAPYCRASLRRHCSKPSPTARGCSERRKDSRSDVGKRAQDRAPG